MWVLGCGVLGVLGVLSAWGVGWCWVEEVWVLGVGCWVLGVWTMVPSADLVEAQKVDGRTGGEGCIEGRGERDVTARERLYSRATRDTWG